MKGLDLFCGAGGFSLGVGLSGLSIHKAFDNDQNACDVYQKNFPNTEIECADIEQINFTDFYGIDFIQGGPPCQGFSLSGLSLVDDPRNKLILEFARAVGEASPEYFVMETVPGILRPRYQNFLNAFLAKFEDYNITPLKILNAVLYGVPQKRKRVFILGAKKGFPLIEYPMPAVSKKINIKEAIGDLPTQGQEEVAAIYIDIDTDYGKSLRLPSAGTIKNCTTATHSQEIITRFTQVPPGKRDPVGHQYRLKWDGQSPTIKAGTDSRHGRHSALMPIHPQEPRMLSVRECARISSFPDGFEFTPGRFHGARQVGNAVPPLLARAIGYALQGVSDGK